MEVVEVVELVVGVVHRVHVVDNSFEGEAVEEVVEEVVEVMAVVELAEVEVEPEKTNQRGLPYDAMAQSTSFWRPLLHCLSSSSGSWWSPLAFPGLSFFGGGAELFVAGGVAEGITEADGVAEAGVVAGSGEDDGAVVVTGVGSVVLGLNP